VEIENWDFDGQDNEIRAKLTKQMSCRHFGSRTGKYSF